MQHSSIELKSSQFTLTLVMDPSVRFEQILSDVAGKFRTSSRFFKGAQMALEFRGRELSDEQQREIVRQIRQNCGEKAFQAYEDMEQKYGLNFYDIHWDSYWHDTMVSVVIEMESNMSFTDYYVCNYDFSMGRSVPNFELLQRYGLDYDEFITVMKEAAVKYYDDLFAEVPAEYKDTFYQQQRDWTGSDENITVNLMMFIDENGDLAVVTPIGSIAGANWYYHIVRPLAQD